MNRVEVSEVGRSLMFLLLLGCLQGEPHFAAMTLISSPQNVHFTSLWPELFAVWMPTLWTRRKCRVWDNQTCFCFNKALRCTAITSGHLSWKLHIKQEKNVVPLNCHSVCIRKEPTFLHSEPVDSYFAHHSDNLSDLMSQPYSLIAFSTMWHGRESTVTAASSNSWQLENQGTDEEIIKISMKTKKSQWWGS